MEVCDSPPMLMAFNAKPCRWMRYPGFGFAVRHPHDQSIATFRGHEVRQTLIRAYFSPAHTTAQRYVYRCVGRCENSAHGFMHTCFARQMQTSTCMADFT